MWLKLFLLTLYLLFLFVLSRLLETAAWYHDTGTFLTSFAVFDPISLSVKKLKQLLDDRGVSYTGVVEKQELIELVTTSGTLTTDEIREDTSTPLPAESTQFTCGSHFYEEVEDTKDSAWLVQVVVNDSDNPLLPDATWKEVRIKVASFGIRTGVFKCSLDKRLCNRKGWTSARLILALPRGNKAKEDVVLHNLMLPSTSGTVLQWVRKYLSSRVKEINSASELNNWLSYSDSAKTSELRVILFSILKSCPMFLSALAIKFNGRVKFGTVDTSKVSSYKKHLDSNDLPVYLVVTPEKTIVYGKRRGESYNFKSMELFLRTFVPEINDVFLWSLIFVNALAGFELFFMYSHVWKHFLLYALCAVKYNCSLFFLWLMILALFQFPIMQTCTDASLQVLRFVSGSNVASILRCDYKSFYSHTFLLVTYIIFASISGYILRRFKWFQPEDTSIFSNWWQHSQGDSTLSTYFFRPRVSLMQPFASQNHDLEVGIELLIERMAVPNLWLQPVISMDYIKDLPMWRYNGWCEADDELEESRGCSSDDEMTPLVQQPQPPVPSSETNQNTLFQTPHSSQELQKVPGNGTVPFHNEANSSPCVAPISTNIPKPDIKRAPTGMLEFRECSICLESYRYSEVLCGLPCGHNFHMNCIMSWLSRDNHCCPICRWPSYKFKNLGAHLHSQ
ncbi:hypothetical protein JTE90_003822 [Oedothorax gibbosus]|uniref:RING-type domain-containing protein n=1 Tax=Oedothorax gibbosus TaxID=931172 RepID=A0AAV6VID3_9ARAC|nr:hypothetical protein JTE90_003822 [Oedothorax gibbosus]